FRATVMRTLQDLLREIEGLGNNEAVRLCNGGRTWIATYAELYGKTGAIVEYFDRKGIRKGDRVLIWPENRMEWVAVFWTCVSRGIEAVPVDFRFSPDLVERIRIESKPKMVVDNATLNEAAEWRPLTSFTMSDVSPGDVVEIVYTSGTTGEPKGVIHRHRN